MCRKWLEKDIRNVGRKLRRFNRRNVRLKDFGKIWKEAKRRLEVLNQFEASFKTFPTENLIHASFVRFVEHLPNCFYMSPMRYLERQWVHTDVTTWSGIYIKRSVSPNGTSIFTKSQCPSGLIYDQIEWLLISTSRAQAATLVLLWCLRRYHKDVRVLLAKALWCTRFDACWQRDIVIPKRFWREAGWVEKAID